MIVAVKGWPATVFLSTKEEHIQELATRSFTVTPESHEAKHRDAIRLQGIRDAFPWTFDKTDNELISLQHYIRYLRDNIKNLGVVVPFSRELSEIVPAKWSRSMRDSKHIRALIKTCTLLHIFQRPVALVDKIPRVMCTFQDLNIVLEILPELEETTTTGLPRQVLDCFHKAMEPLAEIKQAFSYSMLTSFYNSMLNQQKSSMTMRGYVKLLRDIGWVDTERDPENKRSSLIRIIKKKDNDMFGHVLNTFSNSFTLENLRSWLDDIKKMCSAKHIFLKQQINSDIDMELKDVYEQYYSPTLLSLCKTDSAKHIIQKEF